MIAPIDRFIQTVKTGAKRNTWEGMTFALDQSLDEITRVYHVTMGRRGEAFYCNHHHDNRAVDGYQFDKGTPEYTALKSAYDRRMGAALPYSVVRDAIRHNRNKPIVISPDED